MTSSHCAFLSASQSNCMMIIMWERGTLAFMFLSPNGQLIILLPTPKAFFSVSYHPRGFPPPPCTLTQLLVFLSFFLNLPFFLKILIFSQVKVPWTFNTFQDAVFAKGHYKFKPSYLWSCISHSTGSRTDLTTHTFHDRFCRLVMWQCLIYL